MIMKAWKRLVYFVLNVDNSYDDVRVQLIEGNGRHLHCCDQHFFQTEEFWFLAKNAQDEYCSREENEEEKKQLMELEDYATVRFEGLLWADVGIAL